jgi:hypothetical protein
MQLEIRQTVDSSLMCIRNLTHNFQLFQLALGEAAASALAQNNGTRYTVGNIYDTICKYRHCL